MTRSSADIKGKKLIIKLFITDPTPINCSVFVFMFHDSEDVFTYKASYK